MPLSALDHHRRRQRHSRRDCGPRFGAGRVRESFVRPHGHASDHRLHALAELRKLERGLVRAVAMQPGAANDKQRVAGHSASLLSLNCPPGTLHARRMRLSIEFAAHVDRTKSCLGTHRLANVPADGLEGEAARIKLPDRLGRRVWRVGHVTWHSSRCLTLRSLLPSLRRSEPLRRAMSTQPLCPDSAKAGSPIGRCPMARPTNSTNSPNYLARRRRINEQLQACFATPEKHDPIEIKAHVPSGGQDPDCRVSDEGAKCAEMARLPRAGSHNCDLPVMVLLVMVMRACPTSSVLLPHAGGVKEGIFRGSTHAHHAPSRLGTAGAHGDPRTSVL